MPTVLVYACGSSQRGCFAHGESLPGVDQACATRSLRGGSWNNNAQNLRAANRNNNTPSNANNNVGFRLTSTLQTPELARSWLGRVCAAASTPGGCQAWVVLRPFWAWPGCL
jgi:hypothetical protein